MDLQKGRTLLYNIIMLKKKTIQRRDETIGKPAIHLLENSRATSRGSKVGRMAGLPIVLLIIFIFSLFAFAQNYPDGALIRAKDDIKVYLIENNKRTWIKSPEEFNARKFNWQNIQVISKEEVGDIEEEKVVVESASPSPSSTPLATPPIPAKVNLKFPAPDYARADWLISHFTSNYGRIGQKIVFKYSDKDEDNVKNFRLYEKKPGELYFTKIAEFEDIPSVGCDDIAIDEEWMMTEGNPCGYWVIQKIVPPGGRGTMAYWPAASYSEGEYSYYVAGVDKDGLETKPSPEAKLVFLPTVSIFSPADNKQSAELFPSFKWSIPNWPAGSTADYLILISDDENTPNPFWAKYLQVPAGKFEQAFTYDGTGLNPASKYKIYIYGHYRQSQYDPDYISIPPSVPEFWTKSPRWSSSLWNFLKALLAGSKVRP